MGHCPFGNPVLQSAICADLRPAASILAKPPRRLQTPALPCFVGGRSGGGLRNRRLRGVSFSAPLRDRWARCYVSVCQCRRRAGLLHHSLCYDGENAANDAEENALNSNLPLLPALKLVASGTSSPAWSNPSFIVVQWHYYPLFVNCRWAAISVRPVGGLSNHHCPIP